MAVARGLGATERQVHFRTNRRGVDVGNTGIEVAHSSEGPVHVLRVQRRRKPVLYIIGNDNRILQVFAPDYRDHGSEDFFLGDAHFGIDITEDGGLHEPAVLVFSVLKAMSTAKQLGTF